MSTRQLLKTAYSQEGSQRPYGRGVDIDTGVCVCRRARAPGGTHTGKRLLYLQQASILDQQEIVQGIIVPETFQANENSTNKDCKMTLKLTQLLEERGS